MADRFVVVILAVFVFVLVVGGRKVGSNDRSENEIPDSVSYEPVETTTAHLWKDHTQNVHSNVINPTPDTAHSTSGPRNSLDPMDKYILDGILKIVDEKFSSLDKRLMMVERGINNLQFYNVRNFRVVNTHLHAVDNILHGIHSEIDYVKGKQKESEQSIQGVKKEVLDLQSLNSGMFQAIEQNLVHFHGDMQSRIAELKEGLDQSNARVEDVRNHTFEMRDNIHDIQKTQKIVLQNTEASVILTSQNDIALTSLGNKSDEIIVMTTSAVANTVIMHNSMSSLASDVKNVAEVTGALQTEINAFLLNATSIPNPRLSVNDQEESATDDKFEFRELKAPISHTYMSCGKMLQIIDQKLKHINVTQTVDQAFSNVSCQSTGSVPPDFRSQSRKLMRALSTVNENIFQSVTLYRHTGNLIERVISDTELIAAEQARLRQDLVALLLNGTLDLFNHTYPDFAEFIDFTRKPPHTKDNTKDCPTTNSEQKLTGNTTTELIDILTNLATTSAVSINSSLAKLDQEIERLNKVQDETLSAISLSKTDLLTRDDPKGNSNTQLRDIQNKTDRIFTLAEAIASNTGWIPYFFHNMRFVEAQVNKTLTQMHELTAKTDDIVAGQRSSMTLLLKPPSFIQRQPSANSVPSNLPVESAKTTGSGHSLPDADYANRTIVMGKQMSFVYETSIRLNRLIPALTNLLGEPEPYITLINGASDREGRVEIYHKGVWGTLGQDLSHIEAAYICRKLGYLGGISAGSGHFGPGRGAFWNLNLTCLQTRWCDSVSHVTERDHYNHEGDVGVICDHMLRMVSSEEEVDSVRNSGRLEIYHQNTWNPICFKGWGRKETSIACKQLGFREGAATAVQNDSFVDLHWMTQVSCDGNEKRLDACQYGFDWNGCQDFRHVSVICS